MYSIQTSQCKNLPTFSQINNLTININMKVCEDRFKDVCYSFKQKQLDRFGSKCGTEIYYNPNLIISVMQIFDHFSKVSTYNFMI